jgi:hypothetical protein
VTVTTIAFDSTARQFDPCQPDDHLITDRQVCYLCGGWFIPGHVPTLIVLAQDRDGALAVGERDVVARLAHWHCHETLRPAVTT